MFAYARPALAGFLALWGLGIGGAGPAWAENPSMKVSGWTHPPVGYLDFCRHFTDQCATRGGEFS
jgi:hypothetical protein